DKKRGIRQYMWAYTNEHVLYLQDEGGDENWHVHCVNLATGEDKDLTALPKVQARIQGLSHKFPGEVLLGINDRDARLHDVYRVNLATGEKKLLAKNEAGFLAFVSDDDFNVRFAMRFGPDGGNEILKPNGEGGWAE